MARPKLVPPLFQKGSRDAFLQAPGLLAAWALCRELGAWQRAPKGTRASERLLTCDSWRLLFHPFHAPPLECRCWHRPTVCSGIPPCLPCWSGVGCRPGLGIQGPDSWARLAACWQAGGCRPQTRQEVGAAGETWPLAQGGNLALEETERELPIGFRRRLWEPLHPVFPSPWLQLFQLQGRQLAVGAAGELLGGYPVPLLSFDFLAVFSALGMGGGCSRFPGILEPRGPGSGTVAKAVWCFPARPVPLPSLPLPACLDEEREPLWSPVWAPPGDLGLS